MDSLGLPMTFGNTFAPEVPVRPVPSAVIPSTRGSSSARGPRGAVGAGKRARGRGRGGAAEAYDVRRREKAKDGEALNSGVKVRFFLGMSVTADGGSGRIPHHLPSSRVPPIFHFDLRHKLHRQKCPRCRRLI